MSFSFALRDGDLALLGNQLDLVFGIDKLKQDLDLWLRERFGGDRFHTRMGSILQEFIGGVVRDSTRAEIQNEVMRILQNYQALQLRILKEDPTLLSESEILESIDSIQTVAYYDSVVVQIRYRTATSESSKLVVGVSI